MIFTEHAIVFPCVGDQLLGVVAMPEATNRTGVLLIVGGPQYRVGSHRQFLLLSRELAKAGYPVMRFDCRGMGDSSGDLRNFEAIGEDICAAIDAFIDTCPFVERVVLWGLCDAASASLLYWNETHDVRVQGMVLLNPWVRSEATLARTQIKHYYVRRLLQPEFWRKLAAGKIGIARAFGGLAAKIRQATQTPVTENTMSGKPFHEKMADGIDSFVGQVLLILSANDYTAKEFIEMANDSTVWRNALARKALQRISVEDADHTFSTSKWRKEVESTTLRWLLEVAKR